MKGSPLLQPANSVHLTADKIPPIYMLWDYIFTYQQVFLSPVQKVPSEQMQANFTLKNIISEEKKKTEVASFSRMLILLIPFLFLFFFIQIKPVLLNTPHTTF